MGSNNFRANVLLRVLLLVGASLVCVWSFVGTQWFVTPYVLATLVVLSTLDLIRYVERIPRELSAFLGNVTHHDFSTPVARPRTGKVFEELQDAYRILAEEFRRLNRQKAANYQYLEAVVEHVGVALVCFDEDGHVSMANEPARRLFRVPYLHSVSTLGRVDEQLPRALERLRDGERMLLTLRHSEEVLQLVLYATTFELMERRYTLVSFQNIRTELEQREIDSWTKLIRVLTHEIMNSVTPIISLSRLIRDTMIDESGPAPVFRALSRPEQDDMLRSITAIHARSRGLLNFVEAYRSFAKPPVPEFSTINLRSLLERIRTLMAGEVDSQGILLVVACDDDTLGIRADARQAEQVLINLVRNAVEAVTGRPQPRIELRAGRDERGAAFLQVIDNGAGIAPEHLDDIFVPFFTTKRNGTGVGLSISRQIVHANNGVLSARSTPEDGTVLTLRFPDATRAHTAHDASSRLRINR